MDKKNYLWIGIGVIVVVIALLLVMKTTNTAGVKNTPTTTGTETGINTEVNTPVVDANGQPVAQTVSPELAAAEALPLAKEAILSVDGTTFTPKTIKVKADEKVFMTFSAKDEARHTFSFVDADLSFILVVFSKAEGDKSITFPAPKAGTYTYFVDDKANTGKLIVE